MRPRFLKNSYLDNNWPLNFLKTIIITHKETYCFTYIEAAKAAKLYKCTVPSLLRLEIEKFIAPLLDHNFWSPM